MLNSVLSTPTERESAGVACASLVAAGRSVRRERLHGDRERAQLVWITGVVSWNSGRDALSAPARARARTAAGALSAGPSCAANALDLAERLVGLLQRAGQQREPRLRGRVLRGDRREVGVRRRRSATPARRRRRRARWRPRWRLWIAQADVVRCACASRRGEGQRVAVERREALEDAAQVGDRCGLGSRWPALVAPNAPERLRAARSSSSR